MTMYRPTITARFIGGPLHGEERAVVDDGYPLRAPLPDQHVYREMSRSPEEVTIRTANYYPRPEIRFGVRQYLFEGLLPGGAAEHDPMIDTTRPRGGEGTQCLAVHPVYQDFPPRCRRIRYHEGPHVSFGSVTLGQTEWESDEC